MTVPTKTIGPLHLEDLEPHRFEDLVRQLLYDFRPWRDLEATGRTGSDGGFDARAWETTTPDVASTADNDDGDGDSTDDPAPPAERQWIIQCKREKSISPAKLRAYLENLPSAVDAELHGIFFAAACDFSRAARDLFYKICRERGFQEIKLWGKAEIEDQLFQPKNDHLLFAYFGISLQIRQRTLRTAIRAKLATKKKAKKLLQPWTSVLLRDPADDRYPYPDADKTKPLIQRRRWKVFRYLGCFHDGLHFEYKRHFAFIADDGEKWDAADWRNEAGVSSFDDPWKEKEDEPIGDDPIRDAWSALPPRNQGWLEEALVLPYENVVAIDDEGDEFSRHMQIFVGVFDEKKLFAKRLSVKLENNETYAKVSSFPDPETRISHFVRPVIRPTNGREKAAGL